MNLTQLHTEGGTVWMIPIDVGFIAVLAVLVFLISRRMKGEPLPKKWLDALRHLGGLSLLLGVFGTIAGLYQAFGALSVFKPDGWPFHIIAGGMEVALITVLYGCIVHMVALVGYIVLKVTERND